MPVRFLEHTSPGISRYTLDLSKLYDTRRERGAFEERWSQFVSATIDHASLFVKEDDQITYSTESFLPSETDNRQSVLLLLGNPASQSVRAGMCFAFEGSLGREHRFWSALRATGWLTFRDSIYRSAEEQNAERRAALLSMAYESPFRLGLDVFFSFPSPASTPKWSGVAGLAALFGRKPLAQIALAERVRISGVIRRHLNSSGAVVAFQKDAYEQLRDSSAPAYTSEGARSAQLMSLSAGGAEVLLVCAPPTRLAHSSGFRRVLFTYAREIRRRSTTEVYPGPGR